MGNICGKESADPMAQPGRRVGSAPASGPKTASVPKTVKVGGPARTLGGASPTAGEPGDAGRRAAEAAEVNTPTFKALRGNVIGLANDEGVGSLKDI